MSELPWIPLCCDECGKQIGECKARPSFAYCDECGSVSVRKHLPMVGVQAPNSNDEAAG